MNSLFLLLFTMTIGLNGSNHSTFDNITYVEETWIADMLDNQFVKDVHSPEFINTMEQFMENHFDEIDHISGHFAKESDMHYYAIFGTKDDLKKSDLLEVDQEHFKNGSYFEFDQKLQLSGLCRRGNGYPSWPVCSGTTCQVWTNGCLGIICPRPECL